MISSPGSPWVNMATDDYLLRVIGECGTPMLRFYAWDRQAVSFGYFQAHGDIATWTSVRPLVRRPTGGGLVSHVSDWTYSLAVPRSHAWYRLKARESYARVHRWVSESLKRVGIRSALAEKAIPSGPGQCFLGAEQHDILLDGRKIAGAAQRRTSGGLLIQGSVQVTCAEDKKARTAWQSAMQEVGHAFHGIRFRPRHMDLEQQQAIERLTREKYQTDAFLKRR